MSPNRPFFHISDLSNTTSPRSMEDLADHNRPRIGTAVTRYRNRGHGVYPRADQRRN